MSEKPPVVPRLAEHVLLMEHLSKSPVTAMQIRSWTRRDPIVHGTGTAVYQRRMAIAGHTETTSILAKEIRIVVDG